MITLPLKAQVIWLSMQGWHYRELWHYIRHVMSEGEYYESLTLTQCQAVVHALQEAQQLTATHYVSFLQMTPEALATVEQLQQQSILIGESHYPRLWLEIPKPPLLLYYAGDLSLLQRPLISIVGTRKITPYGQRMVTELTTQLASLGWCCVSGLADGVDRQVHEIACHTQSGKTIAMIPTGLQQCYPRHQATLQSHLMQHQLVMSEYLPHTGAKKHHFIMRNRLVAGIAPALVVIEAAHKSGSLITANYALQYNREVYACPGRACDPYSKGCNELISIGANSLYDMTQFLSEVAHLYRVQQVVTSPLNI